MRAEQFYLPSENVAAVSEAARSVLGVEDIDLQPFDSLGVMTRVYACTTESGDYIIRHGSTRGNFYRDRFVANRFGHALPVPRVLGIKKLKDGSAVCTSERLPGKAADVDQLIQSSTPLHDSFTQILQRLHTVDVSRTKGYGPADAYGIGLVPKILSGASMRIDASFFRRLASGVTGIDRTSLRDIMGIQRSLEPIATKNPLRRLGHGDLQAGNLLSNGREITGIIDWADLAYIDPAHDLGALYVQYPGIINNQEHAAAIDANPDTINQRVLFHAIGDCIMSIIYFARTGNEEQQAIAEARLLEIGHDAETR